MFVLFSTLASALLGALRPVSRRGLPQPLSLLQMTRPQLALLPLGLQLGLLLLQLGLQMLLQLALMKARSCPPPRSVRRAF